MIVCWPKDEDTILALFAVLAAFLSLSLSSAIHAHLHVSVTGDGRWYKKAIQIQQMYGTISNLWHWTNYRRFVRESESDVCSGCMISCWHMLLVWLHIMLTWWDWESLTADLKCLAKNMLCFAKDEFSWKELTQPREADLSPTSEILDSPCHRSGITHIYIYIYMNVNIHIYDI